MKGKYNFIVLLFCLTIVLSQKNFTQIITYPNPTQNILSIKTELSIKEISIYDTLGQKYFGKTFQNQINISQLSKGIHFLKLTDEFGKIHIRKFMKI